jgi:hypothetical protein
VTLRLRADDYNPDVLWFTTNTGKFFPYDCADFPFDIEEIAHALSNTCRFNGHTKKFYSVAEHSVNVMELLLDEFPDNKELAFQALMHDAPEAYLGDIVTPLKKALTAFQKIEHHVETALFRKHNVTFPFSPIVHSKDWLMCLIEKKVLLPNSPKWFDHEDTTDYHKAHLSLVKGLSPTQAKANFLTAFNTFKKGK